MDIERSRTITLSSDKGGFGIGGLGGFQEFSPEAITYAQGILDNLTKRAVEIGLGMKDPIDNGTYGLVVGDDIKGHVPAQLLHFILNQMCLSMSRPIVDLAFVQGSYDVSVDDMAYSLDNQIGRWKPGRNQKVILVTESVGSGKTIRKFKDVFDKRNMAFDIATFVLARDENRYHGWGKLTSDTRLFYPSGTVGSDETDFMAQIETVSSMFYPPNKNRGTSSFTLEVGRYVQSQLFETAYAVASAIF